MHGWGVFGNNSMQKKKNICKLIYSIKTNLITSFFSKFLVKFLRNSIKYLVPRVVSGVLWCFTLHFCTLRRLHFWQLWLFKAHPKLTLKNKGKDKFAALKLMGWGRFLQSVVFDKIYLSGPWGLSLVHPEKWIQGALLIGAVVLQLFWRTSSIKSVK